MTMPKSPGKKWNFNLIFHLILISVVLGAMLLLIQSSRLREDSIRNDKEKVIKMYNDQIDSIVKRNDSIQIETNKLQVKVDSLYKLQNEIDEKYKKEIKSIRSASMFEHTKWFRSLVQRLDSTSNK